MRRLWFCLFYALCCFTIVFSLLWLAAPELAAPGQDAPPPAISDEEGGEDTPAVLAQTAPYQAGRLPAYYLCDEKGRVAVYTCGEDNAPGELVETTDIYVNLLPESDALRIKQGLAVWSLQELESLLEDLGS